MKKLLEFFYGMLIGIANIIPGASGGTIAVVTGIYNKIINSIATILKEPFKSIKNVLFIGIGMVLGLLVGIVGISKLIEVAPNPTFFLFSGLIIGSVPFIFNKVKKEKKDSKSWLILIISAIIIIALPFVTGGGSKQLEFNLVSIVILVFLGMIGAGTMILPGVSGSMVLTIFGYYDSVILLAKDTLAQLIEFNFTTNIILLLSFCLGAVLGVILLAKLIKYLFNKYFVNTFMAILGLVCASSVVIIILAIKDNGTSHIIISIITLIIGVVLGYGLTKLEKKGDNMIDIKSHVEKYKKEALDTLIDLLKIDSVLDEYKENDVYPFGKGNYDCLNYLLSKGAEDNFKTLNVDNYAGHIELGDKGDVIGVLGHLDVVPTVGEWKYNPFEPTIEGDKLIARGTLDDKGPVVASYFALKIIKDLNLDMKNKIRLIVGSDEESGSRCMQRYFSKIEKPNYGFSPDADFPVIYGEKGLMGLELNGNISLNNIKSIKGGTRSNIVCDEVVCEFDNVDETLFNNFLNENNYKGSINGNVVTVLGKSAHAMQPHVGINAIYLLMEFIDKYYPNELSNYIVNHFDTTGKKLNIDFKDEQMGELTINLGIINYVNNNLDITLNLRVPRDEIVEKIINTYKNNPLKLEVKYEYSNVHYVDPNSDFIKKLMNCYQEATGDYESKPFTIGGGTYARIIPGCVAFGPRLSGREDVVHQPNEYIFIEDFYKWIEIYTKVLYELVK